MQNDECPPPTAPPQPLRKGRGVDVSYFSQPSLQTHNLNYLEEATVSWWRVTKGPSVNDVAEYREEQRAVEVAGDVLKIEPQIVCPCQANAMHHLPSKGVLGAARVGVCSSDCCVHLPIHFPLNDTCNIFSFMLLPVALYLSY